MRKETPAALVTGGSRGIGRGICLSLAESGYAVAVNYTNDRKAAEKTRRLCIETSPVSGKEEMFPILQADISSAGGREHLISESYRYFGRIDSLVNNAGVAPERRADITETEEDSFDRLININMKAPYFLTQLLVRRWLKEKDNRERCIVFITSVSAGTASVSRGEYCISKAGLSMAAKLWAVRLAGEGIPVYEVRPGIIATDMTSAVKEKYDSLIGGGLVPQRRWGTPEDIGKAVLSLVRGDFGFSTGTVFNVDGGLNLSVL